MHPTAVEVAIRYFWWKPGVCLFRALELNAYLNAGHHAASTCLDLGCGDGLVARTLMEAGVLGGSVVGLDLSSAQLGKAQALGQHEALCQANAEALPFADAHFGTVLSNGVLEALPHSPAAAIREVGRVLEDGGLFFLTIPTDRFIPNMLWPRIIRRVSPRLADSYTTRLDRRLEHHGTYRSLETWRSLLQTAGLQVLAARPFLSEQSGGIYNLLIMHAFRAAGTLKLLWKKPPPWLHRWLTTMITECDRRDRLDASAGAYALFVARKRVKRTEVRADTLDKPAGPNGYFS